LSWEGIPNWRHARLSGSDPWSFGVIWQVMNESSYEALLPNMGSAKDKHGVRESFAQVTFLFAKNCPFPGKGILIKIKSNQSQWQEDDINNVFHQSFSLWSPLLRWRPPQIGSPLSARCARRSCWIPGRGLRDLVHLFKNVRV
jgi:hypothetical protein